MCAFPVKVKLEMKLHLKRDRQETDENRDMIENEQDAVLSSQFTGSRPAGAFSVRRGYRGNSRYDNESSVCFNEP